VRIAWTFPILFGEEPCSKLELLVGAQRRILSRQRADVIGQLRDFSAIVRELGRARGQGRAPRLDSSTAATWIAGAQSIIAALTS